MTEPVTRTIRLSDEFLAPYYKKGDPFESLLARSTYLTKYCRDKETWTDTIRRVVEASMAMEPNTTLEEAEKLYHLFWTCQALPPGRGLWTGGVEGIPADARYNCWYTSLRSVEDWCWAANQLMLGGGVGIGIYDLGLMPEVSATEAQFAVTCGESHPNFDEVTPDPKGTLKNQAPIYIVDDSREGWVEALRRTLKSAFAGTSLVINVTAVRERGRSIKTFGGVACGPGPLTNLLRNAWRIVREAAGRKLTSVEALDVTNFIGLCIKAGNVRRSALIVLGSASDQDFRNAKKDFAAVVSHRHTSNNSLAFQTEQEIANFDWAALVEDNATFGEPGILNLPLIWKTDPSVKGINPCGEVPLEDRENCNLAEVFPATFGPDTDPKEAFRLVTRYTLRQRLAPLSDSEANTVMTKNMRLGVGIGGLCDFDWDKPLLASWYKVCREEATSYATSLGVSIPNCVTTVKPSGTISLLNGSSPGLHAPFAPYYIRRTRIAKNDPLAASMIEAGVPYEDDIYDKTGRTHVFSFPTKARHTRITVQTETIRAQFERQRDVQEAWSDNAVSATLNFEESEKEELAKCLKEFIPFLKSTSCLPKAHGYAQPPYAPCSQEEYETMYAKINHAHPLTHGGEIEVDECSSGACPTR